MDNERIRELCMSLPHVAETINWGHHLVYWAGDRDIGGKMFAIEVEGMRPTPYSAKNFWVTMERWNVLRPIQIEDELRRAHTLIYEKLPKRTKTVLAMPEKERSRIIRERRKLRSARAKEKAGK